MNPTSNKSDFEDLTTNLKDLAYSYLEKYSPSKQQLKVYLLKKYLTKIKGSKSKKEVSSIIDEIVTNLEKNKIKPTSMIDISDGLASEILHLCKQSEVGCQLYEEKIPIDQQTYNTAMDFNLNPSTCALNGGEDYELLFTINQKDFELVSKNTALSIIGHITKKESGYNLIGHGDTSIPITAQGWSHL